MKILTFFFFIVTNFDQRRTHQAYKMYKKKAHFMSLQLLFRGMSYHLTITCQFY